MERSDPAIVLPTPIHQQELQPTGMSIVHQFGLQVPNPRHAYEVIKDSEAVP